MTFFYHGTPRASLFIYPYFSISVLVVAIFVHYSYMYTLSTHLSASSVLCLPFKLSTSLKVLGKPYSWSERDVSRLGLLLGELEGPEFAAINPEAVFGITSQVSIIVDDIPERKVSKHLSITRYFLWIT